MANQALVDIQAQIKSELANVSKTIAPPSGHRISLKGKAFNLPDGSQTNGALDAIILDWRSVNTYYTGAYNPSKPEDPACFAIAKLIEDLVPSENCKDPQNKTCKGCAWNEWNSAPGGGKGKACKNGVRLAVVPADATADTPIWTIDMPPTSTTNYNNFVNNLSAQTGVLPMQVITKIDFDPDCDYPKLVFSEPQAHENLEIAFALRESAAVLLDKEPISA